MNNNALLEVIETLAKINVDNITEEYVTSVSEYAYWLSQYAELKKEAEETKLLATHKESVLYLSLKEQYKDTTETYIKNLLHSSKEWLELQEKLVEIDGKLAYYQVIVKVLEKKMETLINLGAQIRQEQNFIAGSNKGCRPLNK